MLVDCDLALLQRELLIFPGDLLSRNCILRLFLKGIMLGRAKLGCLALIGLALVRLVLQLEHFFLLTIFYPSQSSLHLFLLCMSVAVDLFAFSSRTDILLLHPLMRLCF